MNGASHPTCIACGSAMRTLIGEISDDRYGCPGVFAIEECVSCGHMTTTPPLTEADLPALYSSYYPRREIDFASLEQEAALVVKRYSRLRRWFSGTDNQGHYMAQGTEKVLDIGCGSCLSLLEMRAMGIDCWGIEADPNVRAIAERYDLRVHIGNIYDVPFPEVKFDLIVLNQVIEHVPDPRTMLIEIRKRLAPGGRVALAFPNTGSIHRRIWKERWINWHIPYHQNHFNRESFHQLAEAAGYSVQSSRTITPNLWSVLQLRVARERKQEGIASTAWSHSSDGMPSPGFLRKVRNVLASRTVRIAGFGIGLGNRLFDAVGRGDSLLMILSPRVRPQE
jgi:SAM-dependent methyltransferase